MDFFEPESSPASKERKQERTGPDRRAFLSPVPFRCCLRASCRLSTNYFQSSVVVFSRMIFEGENDVLLRKRKKISHNMTDGRTKEGSP
mmetsp:Transcript_28773/g.92646  ORF Transcript_28773/g.92646 Transcript_28773/m.92646 type:complete len:89 (-) Transcript_28773:940-1206(-)